MDPSKLQTLIGKTMRRAGFSKERAYWIMRKGGMIWKLRLDRSPYAEKFSIQIGTASVRSLSGIEPASPNDFPIIFWAENLPVVADPGSNRPGIDDYRSAVVASLDLAVAMENNERERLLGFVIECLYGYISGILDEDDLRARYRMGEFKSAFIRKDMRSFLEAGK